MNKELIKQTRDVLNGLFIITGLLINYIYFNFNIIGIFIVLFGAVILSGVIVMFIPVKKNKKRKQQIKNKTVTSKTKVKQRRKVPHNRQLPDDEILKLPVEQLSWREFERLCYLYFKAKGHNPKETKQGADGGVDLIIFDRKYEMDVAVQIKHVKRQITVQDIRELSAAKRNYDCILAKFITSSGFTNDALLQADKFKVETHGNIWIENNIDKWRFK